MKRNLPALIKKISPFFLLLLSLLALQLPSFAQGNDSRGKDFWLMFNTNLGTPKLTLFITSSVNTSGTVSVPGISFTTNFNVTANTVTPVDIPATAAQHTADVVGKKGIHVTSQQEVTVYGLNYITYTTDAYLGLPTDVLGTEYIVMSYTGAGQSQFGIVGTANATTVTINPSNTVGSHTKGTPYSITLNQGDTYEIGTSLDLTGTIITSNKPIGVFGSNQCANIPPGYSYCDHIVEMIPPTSTWGKKFGTVPLSQRTNGDTWRFMASENNTVVKINGAAQPAVNKGQWVEKVLTARSIIESDKPILVTQFSNGSTFSSNPGDPFMMIVPPLEQFLPNYTVTTVSGYQVHFINVVAPNSIVGGLTLDGTPIPAASFTAIPGTGFSGAQVEVKQGIHNLNGSLPFGVFMYGFNQDDSYGYPGGQSFAAIATINTITLTPATGTAKVGTEQCFEALVKDQNNAPLEGVRVDFNITGPHASKSSFAFTGTNGIAQFCYTGTDVGNDVISATVGTLKDESKFTWTSEPVSNVYYSKATGDLHNTATWGVNPDGSGANPPDFGAGKTFNLANRTTFYNMTGNWTVGGTLNYVSGAQLVINGNTLSIVSLNGGGTVTGSATSNLVMNGNDAGDAPAVKFTAGAGSNLKSLTINRTGANGSASIASALNILDVLTVTKGKFNTNNMLTLRSTATSTARVAPVGGSINGMVTVERYIPARRAWRLMNAPVTGNQTIFQAWQEGATTASPIVNPKPGYGTYVTVGTVANGFDQNVGSTSSLMRYDNAMDKWIPLTNTNATMVGNIAYMLFVRGDRSIPRPVTAFTKPNNTTLRAMGNLNVGDQTFNVNATGFTAIPNPFASPIDFSKFTRNNVQNNFYLWDPKLGGKYGVGGYVNVSFNGTSYDVTPAAVSPESQLIQSGQSFLVKSTGAAGSLVIKEADKSATPATNVFVMNPGNNPSDNSQGIRVNLQTIDEENQPALLDEVYSSYNNRYSTSVDALDAIKAPNEMENLAILREGSELMVDRRSPLTNGDTLNLKLWNTTARGYFFEFNPVNMNTSGLFGYLEDRYLGSLTQISLSEVSQVHFSVTTEPQSKASDRFRVIISGKPIQAYVNRGIIGRENFQVYPNPVVDGNINLQVINPEKTTYHLELVNGVGQVIYRKVVQHPGGVSTQRIHINNGIAKGIYQLQIRSNSTKSTLKLFAK